MSANKMRHFVSEAENLISKGNNIEALQLLSKATACDPTNWKIFWLMAQAGKNMGNLEIVDNACRAVLELNPEFWFARELPKQARGYYSQQKQDEAVERFFKLHPPKNRVFVEVGAFDGVHYSNVRRLQEVYGWSGISIEPVEKNYIKLSKSYAGKPVSCVRCAAGDNEGIAELNVSSYPHLPDWGSDIATFNESETEKWRLKYGAVWHKEDVPVKTLTAILRENNILGIDFLSVDTEGHEFQVLKGLDFSLYRPQLIVVEYNDQRQGIYDLLLAKGYQLLEDNGQDLFMELVNKSETITPIKHAGSETSPDGDIPIDPQFRERVNKTVSCRDCDVIPKTTAAGTVINGDPAIQLMHNGIAIIHGAFHGEWMSEIIKRLRGHHEPQEERVFYEILKVIPDNAAMLELGCFWAYYSMWFNRSVKNARNYLIEPNPEKFELGERHFQLNNMAGVFTQAFVGGKSLENCQYEDWDGKRYTIPQLSVDDYLEANGIEFLHLLHSDIQGAEYEMLLGCRRSIDTGKLGYIFISTHGDCHERCLRFLLGHGFSIITSHTIAESFSADGLIVAASSYVPGIPPVPISRFGRHNDDISPTSAYIEDIRSKLNPHLLSLGTLPFDNSIKRVSMDPKDLMTCARFDIVPKYLYAEYREFGIDSRWARELYEAHLWAFNGCREGDGSGKSGIESFIAAFDMLLDSVKSKGFDPEKTLVPIDGNGVVIDGAHRVAACLLHLRPVEVIEFDIAANNYNYEYFQKRGLDPDYCDAIALEYCRFNPRTYIVTVFPSAVGKEQEIREILKQNGDIFYARRVKLSTPGSVNLVRQMYAGEPWVGDFDNRFAGAHDKAGQCFRTDGPVRVYVFTSEDIEKVGNAKRQIRDLFGISNHSVHINDTHEETLRLARILLNANSIHFLNNAQPVFFPGFQAHFDNFKKILRRQGVNEECLCIDGSSVMAAYGIREARDLDYLHFGYDDLTFDYPPELIGSHNSEVAHHVTTRDDIIFNPRNHFYYDGIKFASLGVIRALKTKRGEPKDFQDVALIDQFVITQPAQPHIHVTSTGSDLPPVYPCATRRPKIVGLIPARNEEKIIAQCLRALSLFTDAIVYLDDASTDETPDIVESLAGECRIERIIRKKDWRRDEPGDRNTLLREGRAIGGTHFIVIDADELFTANLLADQRLRKAILSLKPGERLALNWIQLWRCTDRYRFDNSVWTWNYKEIIFCDDGQSSYSSEFIHTPRVPVSLTGKSYKIKGYDAGLLHFQFVNWRNLLLKQAWYRCLEHIREPGKPAEEINKRYAPSKDESNLGLKPAPSCWFDGYPFFDRTLYDLPDEWREEQVLGWFEEFGRDHFAALDIWDIDWRPASTDRPKREMTAPFLVSAIVSTYNAEKFIRGKLEDLEAQTIADRIEIIVIDSGSQEDERSVVEEFQRRYDNIRYIRTEQRETVYQAWNRGIRAATGRFITNANTDDRLRGDAIEVMVNALLANPDKAVAYGDSIVTLVPNETFDRCTRHDYLGWPDFDREKLLELCYLGPHPVWRRELHDTEGYFDESYRCAADYEFWLRLAMRHEFIHIPEPLGLYWLNEGTVSRKGDLPVSEAVGIQQKYRGLYGVSEEAVNPNIFRQSALAHRYCKGKGLEIGGSAHNPFGLDTLNVDFSGSMDTVYKLEEVRICGKAMPVDIVAFGDDIPLPDESRDFIVSSHVLEHFPNPIKALLEWDRLVRPGGIIFMIVPHKERTFDSVQPRTTLQHIIDDYCNNATKPHENPQGHDHCWITEDIVNLCQWMIRELGVNWDIVEVQDVDDKVGNGFTIVIRKTGTRLKKSEADIPSPERRARSVLFVVHGFPPAAVGGVEVYTRNLAHEMASRGTDVTVLYPVTESSAPLYSFTSETVDGLTLTRFHVPRGQMLTSTVSDGIDAVFGGFLARNRFDLIHFHHLFDNLSMSMIETARNSAVPVAVTLHDFWFICPRAQLFVENNGSVCSGPESPGKCADCIELAGWFPDMGRADLERVIAFRHEYVRRLLEEVDLLYAPSRFVADTFQKHGFGGGRIAVAPLGVGEIAVRHSNPAAGPRFGYMGTIYPAKNVVPLVHAFSATTGEASLHLYGGGEACWIEELRGCISDPRITYHGRYDFEDLPGILADIDILVVPSLIESYCFTVREALSSGIPVVAARVGGIPEIVRDGVNGFLFDPIDNQELTGLLQRLISDFSLAGSLNASALPVRKIADDADFLLSGYAAAIDKTALPISEAAPDKAPSADAMLPDSDTAEGGKRRAGKIRVAVFSMDSHEHACGHYRIKAPLEALADEVEFKWGIDLKDNQFTINTDGLESADIIVVQRFLPRRDTRKFLDYLTSLGKPVIYEIDDLLTQLPESNPTHEWGLLAARYIHRFMKKCAAVTVSTDELKGRFSEYNENIHVLPNLLDTGLWKKTSPRSSGPVVIGYAGTNTHGPDLELLEEVLQRVARRSGNEVSFTFMGCSTERISRLPGFRFIPFETTYEAYARILMETPLDIMLAPLEDNPFNRCKSNVKWLEYSACGIAGIYSDLPPYSCVKSGETGLLARNTVDDWYNALVSLIDNPENRRRIAQKAREEVMENYTLARRGSIYLDTYKRLLDDHRGVVGNIRFSIVILTWNRADMLDRCLAALFENLSDPGCCEVIVGNNGSNDHTEEVLSRYKIDRYIKKDENIGLELYRELFNMAEGEYIIELDDDVIDLPRHFDTTFAEYFEGFPDYGFLGLDVVRNRFTNGAKPDPGNYSEDTRQGRTVQEGEVVGCCACIRKETFVGIGGFTGTALSMSAGEDGVITRRVRENGLKTGIIKDVKCLHACGPFYSQGYGYLDRDIEKYDMARLDLFTTTYRDLKEESKVKSPIMVSIIIPLFNKMEFIGQCLESLTRHTPDFLNYEVILVDNASSDGTGDFLKTLSGDVTVITNPKNLGFARACNQGACLAAGDYLVFLNNTIPRAGWLEALVDGMERDGAGICVSRLIHPDGREHPFSGQGIGHHPFKGLDMNDPAVTGKLLKQRVTAACMIMRGELLRELKGFDEGYTDGFEEEDLCLRAEEQGRKIIHVPDSTLIHFEEAGEGRKADDERNALRFLERWKGKAGPGNNGLYQKEGHNKEVPADNRMRLSRAEKVPSPMAGSVGNDGIAPHLPPNPVEKGTSLKQEQRYDEALEIFKTARQQGDTSVLAQMGDCLANLGKTEEAGAAYREALENRPDDITARIGLGVLRLLDKRYAEAERYFGDVLKSDPDNAKALSGLGMVKTAQGKEKEGFNCFTRVLDKDPENLTALFETVKCAYRLERYGEAERHIGNYLRYHPADLNMIFSHAGVLLKMDRRDEARAKLETILLFDPGFKGALEMLQMIDRQLPVAV